MGRVKIFYQTSVPIWTKPNNTLFRYDTHSPFLSENGNYYFVGFNDPLMKIKRMRSLTTEKENVLFCFAATEFRNPNYHTTQQIVDNTTLIIRRCPQTFNLNSWLFIITILYLLRKLIIIVTIFFIKNIIWSNEEIQRFTL